MNPVIMDAGPLIAWFCSKDSLHQWTVATFDQLSSGALVCEAVLTEACHLVAKDSVSLAGETSAIRALMERSSDTPMDFADAGFCTTDSDFFVFRKNRTDHIEMIRLLPIDYEFPAASLYEPAMVFRA